MFKNQNDNILDVCSFSILCMHDQFSFFPTAMEKIL